MNDNALTPIAAAVRKAYHAENSPSSTDRWVNCPGSIAACSGLPDTAGVYAGEGTRAHALHQRMLEDWLAGEEVTWQAGDFFTTPEGEKILLTDDMLEPVMESCVRVCGFVNSMGATATLGVERVLAIDHITGEKNATGTSDVVIVGSNVLMVIDYKHGQGVPVSANGNLQLIMYALAAWAVAPNRESIKRVILGIHQPRLNNFDYWDIPIEELLAYQPMLRKAAQASREPNAPRIPGDVQCKFCRAKATCPEAARSAQAVVMHAFADMPTLDAAQLTAAYSDADLGVKMACTDWLENWSKAVRAETERRLLAGTPVPGYKLVEGRKGNRAWTDAAEAEAALKAMRIKHDQMYDYKVISPTTAEKLVKAEVIGARQWGKLQPLITRGDGKPSVAPESDKRPALAVAAPPVFEAIESVDDLI